MKMSFASIHSTALADRGGLGTRASSRLFFAYGANMNPAQIEGRCGCQPKVVATAALPDYQLGFHGYSKKWDGAQETVDRAPGKTVWGIVYELSFGDAERLDACQDARLDGAGTYFHFPAEVITSEGCRHPVFLYKKDQVDDPREPSREYLEFIVQGALERGLPAQYVSELRGIAAHPAQFEVPRKSKYDSLFGSGCSNCGDLRSSKGGPGFKPAQNKI